MHLLYLEVILIGMDHIVIEFVPSCYRSDLRPWKFGQWMEIETVNDKRKAITQQESSEKHSGLKERCPCHSDQNVFSRQKWNVATYEVDKCLEL